MGYVIVLTSLIMIGMTQIQNMSYLFSMLSYLFLILGTVLIYRKYHEKQLLYTLLLSILTVICLYFDNEYIDIFIRILNVIQVYTLFKGTKYILDKYLDSHKYQKLMRYFIVVFALEQIFLSYLTLSITFIFEIIMLIVFIDINNYLYEQNMSIEKNTYHMEKSYKFLSMIIIILSLIGIRELNDYIPDIQFHTQYYSSYVYLHGKSSNIILENFIFQEDQESSAFSFGYHLPDIYIKKELYNKISYINYSFYNHNEIVIGGRIDINKNENKPYQDYYLCKIENSESDLHGRLGKNLQNMFCRFRFYDNEDNEILKESIDMTPYSIKEYGLDNRDVVIDMGVRDKQAFFLGNIYIKAHYYKKLDKKNLIKAYVINDHQEVIHEFTTTIQDNNTAILIPVSDLKREIQDNHFRLIIEVYNQDQMIKKDIYELEEIQ